MRVTVVGASGFVGSAVTAECLAAGHEVSALPAPRVTLRAGGPAAIARALGEHAALVDDLAARLVDCDVVVNAAGCAEALSRDEATLLGANALVPGLLAAASQRAGARRLVHVSSAAVQGRRSLLDESDDYDPFSPYAESKILGERAVLDSGWAGAVVYRPTSVHGPSRSVTRSVARLARGPFASVAADGMRPTPQILSTSVGSAVRFLAEAPAPPSIVMHPWEGVTTGSLLRALGDGRTPRQLPALVARGVVRSLTAAARLRPGAQGMARRLEMLWFGQAQDASWLSGAGWTGAASAADWAALGDSLATHESTS